MSENEQDCPTCADWDPVHRCTAPIHAGTPCVNYRPKTDETAPAQNGAGARHPEA